MTIAICSIIKDEQQYLKEWLDWNCGLNIDKIFLYEDYNSKSHKNITNKYNNVILQPISVLENIPKISYTDFKQTLVFYQFLNLYKNEFDWIIFIDIDEFLHPKKELHSLLEDFKNQKALLIKEVIMTANGHISKPEGLVQDNYTKKANSLFCDKIFPSTKYAINTKFKQDFISVHRCSNAVLLPTELLYIKHYFTKSFEEWQYKVNIRGDIVHNNRKFFDFFIVNPDLINHCKKC